MTKKADPVKAGNRQPRAVDPARQLSPDPAVLADEADRLSAAQALHPSAPLTPAHVLSIQRLAGNRAAGRWIQAKRDVTPAHDPHEQPLAIEPTGPDHLVQRAVQSTAEWLVDSAVRGRRRSTLLKAIDTALGDYHDLAAGTDWTRMDDGETMVHSYSLYEALSRLRGAIRAWQAQKRHSARATGVGKLQAQVDAEIQKILELRHGIQSAPQKTHEAKSTGETWTALWSGADGEYILRCRGGSAPFRANLPEGLTLEHVKWSSDTQLLLMATRADGVPSLWDLTVGQKRTDEGMEPYVGQPLPFVGGGKDALRAEGYGEEFLPETEETVDMERLLFRDLGTTHIPDIHTLAAKILENLRGGGEIQYTSKDMMMATLQAGLATEAVCHVAAALFQNVVNKMAFALDLPATARTAGEGPLVITEKITAGFLGHDDKEPSNLVGSYSESRRSLVYGRGHPGHVVFRSHTWVQIEGKHYDPVSGLEGSTKPPVQKLEEDGSIDVTLDNQTHNVKVYKLGGLRVFPLPDETEQAQALLSRPLTEPWIVLTP